MPVFTSTGFDDPGFGRFVQQALALDFDLEHQRFHVAGQHDVAAAAEDKFGAVAQGRVAEHGVDVGLVVNARQAKRLGRNAKAVGRLKGNVFLD